MRGKCTEGSVFERNNNGQLAMLGQNVFGQLRSRSAAWLPLLLLLLLAPVVGRADSVHENVFASIMFDGKKIGQIHYVLKLNPTGEVEELRTHASVSMLGIKLYNFAQHLHETWRNGALQTLRSDADDNGTEEKAQVKRVSDAYEAERNGTSVDLPTTVFPDSIWHYRITKQSQIFSSVDLRTMAVSVARADDTVTLNGKSVAAERFDFTGDWQARLWYGKDRRLLKAQRSVENRSLVIVVDSDS
jgi:hypothetical protein